MHDQRNANTTPRDPATPPPLPQRPEPRIELRIEPATTDSSSDGTVPSYLAIPKRQAVYFGLGGFVAGIVFWHAVGFWGVVQSTVYKGTDSDVSSVADAQPVTNTSGTFADAIDRAISQAASEGETAGITTGAIAPEKTSTRMGGGEAAAAAEQTNCASFTRDRTTGEVISRPCSEAERTLPHNPDGTRENFAEQNAPPAGSGTVSRWSTHAAPTN